MNNRYLELLNERKIEEAEKYRKSTIPQKLVKFFPLNGKEINDRKRLDTLATEKIWFSSVEKLNDPMNFSVCTLTRKNWNRIDIRRKS